VGFSPYSPCCFQEQYPNKPPAGSKVSPVRKFSRYGNSNDCSLYRKYLVRQRIKRKLLVLAAAGLNLLAR